MERNIITKVHNYTNEFKDNLQQWIEKNNCKIMIGEEDKTNDFVQYMNDFPNIELCKQDFQKRKRIKNSVPDYNRCIALKFNGCRCSRKQKHDGTQFCGTHMKGSPYGTIEQKVQQDKVEKIQLWLQDINGISRYIDSTGNVYCTEDIMNSMENPRVIGKYMKNDNDEYFMVN